MQDELTRLLIEELKNIPPERLESITDNELNAVVTAALEQTRPGYIATAKQSMPDRIAYLREFRAGYEARLLERWRPALDLFDFALDVAQTIGNSLNARYGGDAKKSNDFVFLALSRIHAHACLTVSEVGALLRTGHPSAAMARWRTLHELSCVMSFLKAHGQGVAEAYLLHISVEAANDADEYQQVAQRIGYTPFTLQDLAELHKERDALTDPQRFGKAYGKDYGWAASVFGHSPTFREIEKATKRDHLRSHYRMASRGVHPNSNGFMLNLGTMRSAKKVVYLAGPSNYGLADPGHATLISLLVCTAALVTLHADLENTLALSLLQQLTDEAGDAFLAAQKQIEQEERQMAVAEK